MTKPTKPTKPTAAKQTDRRGKRTRADAAPIRFTAALSSPRNESGAPPDWSFVRLPEQASNRLPARGPVSVDGSMNGAAFQATLQPDGDGGHWLRVEKKLRDAAKTNVGDSIAFEITPVSHEPEPEIPPDLRKALAAAAPKAREAWRDITPLARRDWVQWITSGKRAETRAIRIDKACDMLAKGKRRPCCFDRSGMYDKSLTCPVAEARPRASRG